MRLELIHNEYKRQKFDIAAKHTETFINVVNKLIEMGEDKAEGSSD